MLFYIFYKSYVYGQGQGQDGLVNYITIIFSCSPSSSLHSYPTLSQNKLLINLTRQSLQFLLLIVLFFITVNFFTLSVFERRIITFALLKEEERGCEEPTIRNTLPRVNEQKVEKELVQQQVEGDVVVIVNVAVAVVIVIVRCMSR